MSARVSVIIATYNQGPYLSEALESVLAQSGPTLEVIVVDDASTDNTPEVLGRYASRIQIIRLMKNQGGPAGPRNVAMKAASGEFVAIFDGDDVMQPGKLAAAVDFFDAHPDVPFLFTNFRNFSSGGLAPEDFLSDHREFHEMEKRPVRGGWVIPRQAAYDTLISDNFIGTSGVVIRRSLVSSVGFFDETLRRSEDIEYWYRIARKNDLGYLDLIGHHRRLHGTNISSGAAPLAIKIEIYKRQNPAWMSPSARRNMHVMIGRLHYSIGFIERQAGRRWSAAGHYLKSSFHFFNGGRALRSILSLLLPSSLENTPR